MPPLAEFGASILRRVILWLAHERRVAALARRYGLRLGASRFVAAATIEQAAPRLRALRASGVHTTIAMLGEGVTDQASAAADTETLIGLIRSLAPLRLEPNISLKPSHIGLAISQGMALKNVRRIMNAAVDEQCFVRLDMEASDLVDATLDLYWQLRDAGYTNLGVVVQSCLRRTPADVEQLVEHAGNIRLVKGAYQEPASVAYPHKAEVDAAYLRLARRLVGSDSYVAFATHDQRLIDAIRAECATAGVDRDRFEFQMLYGVRGRLQTSLAGAGYTVRVYTPFGTEWWPYLMRRLAERPANVGFVLRSLLRR